MSSGCCAGQTKPISVAPSRSIATSVGARGPHLEDDVGLRPQLGGGGHDLGARRSVGVVREVRCVTRARFHRHAEAQLDELLDDVRDGGYAFFARKDLARYRDRLRHALLPSKRKADGRMHQQRRLFNRLALSYMPRQSRGPASTVEARPPMSRVFAARRIGEHALDRARRWRFRACAWPRKSSISAADQIWPMGWRYPCPAMSGAEPCTGSNSDGKVRSGLMLADGAMPIVPHTAGPRSERMSPKRLEPTTTSKSLRPRDEMRGQDVDVVRVGLVRPGTVRRRP